MDRGAWRATVYGVAKSQTRLSDFTFHGIMSTQQKKAVLAAAAIFFFFFNIHEFIWLRLAFKLLVASCGIQFPDQGLNPGPLP